MAYLLLLQLPLKCANPVRPSNPAESKNSGLPKLGPNLVLIHNFSHNETKLRQDYQNTLNGNEEDQIAIANEPVMTTSKEMPLVLQGGSFDDFVNPPPQLPAPATHQPSPSVTSSDSVVDLPLFYPPLPDRPTSYGTIRDTFNPHPERGNSNSRRQSSGSASFKPNIFGFPVISNTRENVGHQISW